MFYLSLYNVIILPDGKATQNSDESITGGRKSESPMQTYIG